MPDGKPRIDSAIRIPCSVSGDFFEKWFQILKPIHHLSNTELKVLAEFCRVRYEYSQKITDADTLDSFLFSSETKNMIMANLGIPQTSFRVSMSKLRKAGIIVNGKINQKLLPKLSSEQADYKLLLYFDLRK